MDFEFELGQTIKDVITGFEGVVLGRTQYLTQCNCYLLVPQGKTKTKRLEGEWFDADRLKMVKKSVVKLPGAKPKPKATKKTGPDIMAPTK